MDDEKTHNDYGDWCITNGDDYDENYDDDAQEDDNDEKVGFKELL